MASDKEIKRLGALINQFQGEYPKKGVTEEDVKQLEKDLPFDFINNKFLNPLESFEKIKGRISENIEETSSLADESEGSDLVSEGDELPSLADESEGSDLANEGDDLPSLADESEGSDLVSEGDDLPSLADESEGSDLANEGDDLP